MGEEKTANEYRESLNDLGNNFDIFINQNKDNLINFYSNTSDDNLDNKEDRNLDLIFNKTYVLHDSIKKDIDYLTSTIKGRNDRLIARGIDMAELNKKLADLKNKSDASEPRKKVYKEITQQDILLQIAYVASILGGIYVVYKFFKR